MIVLGCFALAGAGYGSSGAVLLREGAMATGVLIICLWLRPRISELRERELPRQIAQTIESMNTQLAAKNSYLESASSEIRRIPARMIQEQRLDREAKSLATLYTDLQSRYQAARLAEATAIPDVKLVPANPRGSVVSVCFARRRPLAAS